MCMILIMLTLQSCFWDIGRELVNNRKTIYDLECESSKRRFGICFESKLDAIDVGKEIKKYSSDTSKPRLAYIFGFHAPTIPDIKIHSFSFTRLNGDVIPSVLYYKCLDGVEIIDSFPIIISENTPKKRLFNGLDMVAECSESYYKTKNIYINFDMEVGGVRVDTSILYSRKWYIDRLLRF